MNKAYLCVLPLMLFLAASSGDSIAQPIECEEAPAPAPNCTGEPQAPMVLLNLEAMIAAPQCIVAHPGTTLVFRLRPRAGLQLNTVKIRPKDPSDFWLKGQNDVVRDLIIIKVPGPYNPDEPDGATDHFYRIETPTRCRDPRVQVEH